MNFHPKKWSLATKWSLLVMLMAVVPLASVIYYSYGVQRDGNQAKTLDSLQNGVIDAAASMDAMLDERIRQATYAATLQPVLDFTAASIVTRELHRDQLGNELDRIRRAYPYLEAIDVMDAGGFVIYSTTPNKLQYKDDNLLKTIRAGKVYVSGLQPQPGQQEPSLIVAAPIGAGAKFGAVRLQSSPRALINRVGSMRQQGDGAMEILLDEEGRVLTGSDPALAAKSAVTIDKEAGTLTTPDGKLYLVRSVQTRTVPWTYGLAIPQEHLDAESLEIAARSLVLALGTLLIVGALTRLMALRMVRPIARLAEATRALSGGDLTYVLQPSGRSDEVGHLETGFAEAYKHLRRLVTNVRMSSHLLAEACDYLHTRVTTRENGLSSDGTTTERLLTVAKRLEEQVTTFKV